MAPTGSLDVSDHRTRLAMTKDPLFETDTMVPGNRADDQPVTEHERVGGRTASSPARRQV